VTTATSLHPRGVNHLALSTRDMKLQLEFWCDVLGCPLRALYFMHGVEGAYHGFVELAVDSYVAFVQHPDNPKDIEWGVTHAGNPGGAVTIGGMQHVALHVDSLDEVLTLRDRIRSRGMQVIGPIDHGFIKSIYFGGPEGLSLEVCCGHDIDADAWVDPEVVGLCDISTHEVEVLKHPVPFERPEHPVPQPPNDPDKPTMHYPEGIYAAIAAMSDELIWETASEPLPPVTGKE
jgi:catechol 2,3-dioxygenase-like lactoylglutathione lyase family enzyme